MTLKVTMAEVVAQAVERWHSVQAGRVGIPSWTWAFCSSDLLSIYPCWASGFFSQHVIERCLLFIILLCFLSSLTTVKFIYCDVTLYQDNGKIKSKKLPGKALIKLNFKSHLRGSSLVNFKGTFALFIGLAPGG